MMPKNKKGVIGATMTLGIATIIIIALTIVFVLLSSFVKAGISGRLAEDAEKLQFREQAHYSLVSYLKTPVHVDINNISQEVTMADLIRIMHVSEKDDKEMYEKILGLKSKEILDGMYGVYVLLIGDDFGIDKGKFRTINERASFDLPLDAENKIKVTLVIGK